MADEQNTMITLPDEDNEPAPEDEPIKQLEDFVTAEYRKQKVHIEALLMRLDCINLWVSQSVINTIRRHSLP